MSDATILRLRIPGSKLNPRQLHLLVDATHVHVSITALPTPGLKRLGLEMGRPIGHAAAYFRGPLGFCEGAFVLKGTNLYVGLCCIEVAVDEAAAIRQRFEHHGLVIESAGKVSA